MRFVQQIIDRFSPARLITNMPMIFVCGISRSGTTLLTTILDAHSKVSMGYELFPPPIINIKYAIDQFGLSLKLAGGDFRHCGRALRKHDSKSTKLAQWFMRCHRAGLNAEELNDVLQKLASDAHIRCLSFYVRLRLASNVMEHIHDRTSVELTGFKLPGNQFEKCLYAFPNSYFICIIRDPRDTFLSHKKRKFPTTPRQLSRSWKWKIRYFESFHRHHPDRSILIRYEDLVRDPQKTLSRVFDILPIELEPDVLKFHESNATVFNSPHPETVNLRQGFFSSGIGRWRTQLADDPNRIITQSCSKYMRRYSCQSADDSSDKPSNRIYTSKTAYRISRVEILMKNITLMLKRKYSSRDYFTLLEPYLKTHESLRMGDYVQINDLGDRQVLLIRHDVDKDLENSLRMAKWEHDRGIRATYFLLHSAWYYGKFNGNHIRHSSQLIDGVYQLIALGHEVGIHNNLLLTAIRHRFDPIDLLCRELEFFNSIGVNIVGTAGHGDVFCRENRFRNWELFAESCTERFGGPRKVRVELPDGPSEVEVGVARMADFGLLYEAYDLGCDVHISDSGGKIRKGNPGLGKRLFGRRDPKCGHVVIVLTHPVWWTFWN